MGHPELYSSGPDREQFSLRMMIRWFFITIIHFIIIYFITVPILSLGGMTSSAFKGLMFNNDIPGDGEIDFRTYGTIIFAVLIITLGFKVLCETSSIIYGDGKFYNKSIPPEKWYDRYPWTWIGLIF